MDKTKIIKTRAANILLVSSGVLLLLSSLLLLSTNIYAGCSCVPDKEFSTGSHEIFISKIPTVALKPGGSTKLNITIINNGDYTEDNLNISIVGLRYGWIIKSEPVKLKEDTRKTIEIEISAPNYAKVGRYNLTLKVSNRETERWFAEETGEFTLILIPKCRSDNECNKTSYCSNNSCTNKKVLNETCAANNECMSKFCVNFCVECKTNKDCINEWFCINNSCIDGSVIMTGELMNNATNLINNSSFAISEAYNFVDLAKKEGKLTKDAEIRLMDSVYKLNSANDSFNARNYKDAVRYAKESINRAAEAKKLAMDAEKPPEIPKIFNSSFSGEAVVGNEIIIKITSNETPVEGAEVTFNWRIYRTNSSGEATIKLSFGGTQKADIFKEGYESKSVTLDVGERKIDMTYFMTLALQVMAIILISTFLILKKNTFKNRHNI